MLVDILAGFICCFLILFPLFLLLFLLVYLPFFKKFFKQFLEISRERNEQLHLISDRLNEINVTLDNISKGVWYEK